MLPSRSAATMLLFAVGPIAQVPAVDGTVRAVAAMAVCLTAAALMVWVLGAERQRRRVAQELVRREQVERAEQLEREYGRVLACVAEGRPLAECLRAVTEGVERLQPGVRACVLLEDADRGAIAETFGARLPESFGAAVRGAPLPRVGSTERTQWDVACNAHGLRAWSVTPVIGAGGCMLASFVLGFGEAREATAWERRVARFAARTVGVAIARHRVATDRDTNEAQLRAILDGARDFAVITLDTKGTITAWNRGAQKLLGWSAKEVVGRDGLLIFIPEDVEAGRAAWELATAMSDGKAEDERWHVRKDGTRFWGSGLVIRITDDAGEPIGLVKVMRDRTEARLAEIAVRESEQRFRSLVSVVTDVSFIADAEGQSVRPQHAWESYTGQTFEEYRDFGWVAMIHPDDRERIETQWREACRTRTLYQSSGRMWHAPTRSYRWFEARAVPILEEDGTVREWVGACTDVHERKEAEHALHESARRKDEFLAVLAHELRNPLAPIRHGLELLRAAATEPAARARVIQMMERQVGHLVRLVEDLLEVSRITRGKIALRRELVDLVAVVHQAVETAAPAIDAGGHRLAVDVPEEPVPVEVDPVRLTQVVANLLGNAAKFTDQGGAISVTVRRMDDRAEISVRDTGVGITEEMLPRVFDPFTQIDRTVGRAQGGLGIGLALVATLVRLHDGTVEARSEGPGRGSEFVVTLPLSARALHAGVNGDVQAHGNGASTNGRGRPILVVDDNRDAADSLAMLIELRGREVRTAYDGPTGLEVIRAQHPALVFLDLGMPDMDGYEVASAVRRDPALRDVRLVALTGWGAEEDRRRSQEAGFDYHLVKPVDASTLESVLSTFGREVTMHEAAPS